MKNLSAEEIRALDGIVADKTNYLISIEEDCDPSRITRRLQSAMKKLGVRTRTGLAVKWDRMKRS